MHCAVGNTTLETLCPSSRGHGVIQSGAAIRGISGPPPLALSLSDQKRQEKKTFIVLGEKKVEKNYAAQQERRADGHVSKM